MARSQEQHGMLLFHLGSQPETAIHWAYIKHLLGSICRDGLPLAQIQQSQSKHKYPGSLCSLQRETSGPQSCLFLFAECRWSSGHSPHIPPTCNTSVGSAGSSPARHRMLCPIPGHSLPSETSALHISYTSRHLLQSDTRVLS